MNWIDGAPDKVKWQVTRSDGTVVDMDPKDWPVGVLMEVKPDKIARYESPFVLVGHVNQMGGTCDDCAYHWEPEDIIRHKVIWTEGDN